MTRTDPILEPHERQAHERQVMRRKILDAARAIFAERGYEQTTLREIARAISYTAPAVLKYFPSKRAILLAVCDEDFAALQAAFGSVDAVEDHLERLRVLGRAYVEFARTHPNQYRLMFMTRVPDHDPAEMSIERGNPDQDAYAFLRKHVAAAIDAGRLRPELTDPDLVAQALWGSVHGIVALNETKGDDSWCPWRPLDATAELVLDGMIRGLAREAHP
jgi:AcrR family transcriptional regulator